MKINRQEFNSALDNATHYYDNESFIVQLLKNLDVEIVDEHQVEIDQLKATLGLVREKLENAFCFCSNKTVMIGPHSVCHRCETIELIKETL